MTRIVTLKFSAALALSSLFTLPLAAAAQQAGPYTPPVTDTAAPLSKSQMKDQRRQQKEDEKTAKETSKAAKEQSKALQHQDKATNAAEKAQQDRPAPSTTAPPQE